MGYQPNRIIEAKRVPEVIQDALNAFTRATGLNAKLIRTETTPAKNRAADALIEIKHRDQKFEFITEVKTVFDRAATIGFAKDQLAPYGKRGLLITPYVTATLAEKCRGDLQLQFIDAAGNAYINQDGLYVFMTGARPALAHTQAIGNRTGGTATAQRMIFALLCNPELVNATYRDIAAAAGIALGTVGWVFFDLENRGFLIKLKRKGKRRLIKPRQLFEEWVNTYATRLKPKLNLQRFITDDTGWWRIAQLAGLQAFWGGEVAADRLTGHLKPVNCTIYVRPQAREQAVRMLAHAHRLRADYAGNVEILDAFWDFPPDANRKDVAPPILVYADLIATLDPRNLEIARDIRAKYIDHAFDAF